MPDLLDIDVAVESDLLARVALGADAVALVPVVACCDWGVVADLLADEVALVVASNPLLIAGAAGAEKQLAEKGVKGFLNAVGGLTPGVLLPAEGGEEPFQDCEEAEFRGGLVGWSCEEVWVRDPVAGEFGGGFVG